MNNHRHIFILLMLMHPTAWAELEPLADDALTAVEGNGIGLVLENYQLTTDAGSTWSVYTDNPAISLVFRDFAWTPSPDSDASDGSNATETSTLGRTTDPIYLDTATSSNATDRLLNGNTTSTSPRTYLHLAAPQSTLVTDLMDATYKMRLDHGTGVAAVNRYDDTFVTARQMNIDGSYLRLWSEALPRNLLTGAVAGSTTGLAYVGNLNVSADSLTLVTNNGEWGAKPSAAFGNVRLGPCPTAAYCDNPATLYRGFEYVYEVGQDFYQPVTLRSLADGNFVIEMAGIPNIANIYNAFYATPKGKLRIGSLITDWDGVSARPVNDFTRVVETGCGALNCGGLGLFNSNYRYYDHPVGKVRQDFGYSRMEGIRIQYFKVETIGL